jgi:oxygen-independent coproporphyrinogen-3 oxidase
MVNAVPVARGDGGTGGTASGGRRFQIYIHVPYCYRRCGYCDFNTYVAPASQRNGFADLALRELELVADELDQRGERLGPTASVYFGGGTPSLLPAGDLGRMLRTVGRIFGLAAGAEVTTEANPDTVDAAYLALLADQGFTRISFGMQSAVPDVLRGLDRQHDPERVRQVVAAGRQTGLDGSVDLIYGTPGETLADWETSLRAALDLGVNHVSAYALTLEPHTPMARRIRRGELAPIDEDQQAEKYELADELLGGSGLNWYEISNWARAGHESQHNLGYWTGAQWWGIGPGAHSSIGSERFWNAKAPATWAAKVKSGELPLAGRDQPNAEGLELERVMLALRTVGGVALASLQPQAAQRVDALVADGLVQLADGRLSLTRRGRLLADTVTRHLTFI